MPFSIIVRPAISADADMMSAVLAEIIALWKSDRPTSPDHIRAFYIEHPERIECSVAVDEAETIVGFQSLRLATPGNSYEVTPGWGIIGTYVKLGTARRGIGSALFAASHAAAQTAGLPAIDATIGADNEKALAYYEAMGFRTYRQMPGAISKRYDFVPDPR